jgi:hypothetical protein
MEAVDKTFSSFCSVVFSEGRKVCHPFPILRDLFLNKYSKSGVGGREDGKARNAV